MEISGTSPDRKTDARDALGRLEFRGAVGDQAAALRTIYDYVLAEGVERLAATCIMAIEDVTMLPNVCQPQAPEEAS